MAEFVVIFDSATGGYLTKQAGADHIANAAVVSALIASGGVGGPHLAAGGLLSAHYASGSIGSSHLGYSPGGAAVTSGSILTTDIASGGLRSGGLASGGQDLTIVAFRRPSVELGSILISGTWDGSPQTINIPSGLTTIKTYTSMFLAGSSRLNLQINAESGGNYFGRLVELGGLYATAAYLSGNSFQAIPAIRNVWNRPDFAVGYLHALGSSRHSYWSMTPPTYPGTLAAGDIDLRCYGGWRDGAVLVSGLTFWAGSGDWASGSVIKVFGHQL